MKKCILMCVIASCSLLLYGNSVEVKPGLTVTEQSNGYEIVFYMPDFQIVTDTVITMSENEEYFSSFRPYGDDKFDRKDSAGLPALPFYSTNLILPFGAYDVDVTLANILDTVEIYLPLDYTPSQEIPNYVNDYSYDSNYYGTYGDIMHWVYYTIAESNLREYQGVAFSFFPCFYEPVSRKLTIVTKAEFEITYSGDDLFTFINSTLPDGMDVLPYNFYDNFIETEYPFTTPPIDGDEYLIIVAHGYEDDQYLSAFIDHKTHLGYNVRVATAPSDVGYTANDIHQYIYSQHELYGTKFVLLVGNPDFIPFYGTQEDVYDPPTDTYYSCLSYSDIDEQWKDLNPTVYVGRWPINSSSQLQHIVTKTINMDANLGNYNSEQICLYSGDSYWSYRSYIYNTLDYVHDNAYNWGYPVDLLDGHANASSGRFYMTSRLSSSTPYPVWMFVYEGEGNTQGMGEPYRLTHIGGPDSVSTSTLPFQSFGFGFAPLLGNIYNGSNFSREWVGSENGGATFMGATTENYLIPDRGFCHYLFDQLENRKSMTIGEFIANGKTKYYNADKVVYRRREVRKYVLYGDPSLYIYGLDTNSNTPLPKPAIRDEYGKNTESFDYVGDVQIYSISGQLLLSGYSSDIDYNILPAGAYLKVINTENGNVTEKLVVK